ncbi:hypothetical protein FRB98_001448 [Tulasnella sp. 332]|nr:hypothetical protein FRB98_001448 [Tulasnella sp. 332]
MESLSNEDLGEAMEVFVGRVTRILESRAPSHLKNSRGHQIQVADMNLARVEDAISDLNLRLDSLIFKHRRLRNQAAPIHQLPYELLVKVFFFTVQGSDASYFSQLHKLAQVSSKWLQLIKGTPSLFGYVTTDGTMEDALRALRLSKDTPLDVKCYMNVPSGPVRWLEDLIEILLPQAYRWRSIELGDAHYTLANRILSQPAPQIRDIHITCINYVKAISLDPPTVGRLRYLTLNLVTVQWDPSKLKGLKVLELVSIENRLSLLEIIDASRGLEVLHLRDVVVDNLVTEERAPVELLQLVELSLSDLPLNTVHNLLAHLLLPNCKRLTLYRIPRSFSEQELAVFRSTHMGLFQSILASICKVVIQLVTGMTVMQGIGGSAKLELELPTPSFSGIPGGFEFILKWVPESVPFTLVHDDPENFEAPFPLLHHTSITALHIHDSFVATRWIKDLSAPTTIDGSWMWLLPRLKALTFYRCDLDSNNLVKMIGNRYGRDSGTEEESGLVDKNVRESGEGASCMTEVKEECSGQTKDGHVQHSQSLKLPAPLDLLDINDAYGVTPSNYKELREIIGHGNVIGGYQCEDDAESNEEEDDESF